MKATSGARMLKLEKILRFILLIVKLLATIYDLVKGKF